ncbi:MAG: helix-turn-helix domain-containing protein [Bryobacteraceae bacterium]
MITVLQLEQLRRRAGVSLQAISESTKIGTTYLRAIESEEFEKLPGGVFDTNFIRQYAAAIGFPESELIALYRTKTAPEPEQADPVAERVSPTGGVFRACINWLRNPSPLAR